MNLIDRISAFAQLSDTIQNCLHNDFEKIPSHLQDVSHKLKDLVEKIVFQNPWFSEKFVRYQLLSVAKATTHEKLSQWCLPYEEHINNIQQKNIAVIMAGNIPLVGFFDFLTVLITGHRFTGKLSAKDNKLILVIAEMLIEIEPKFDEKIKFEYQFLKNFDAVIATGSNNSARYFEYYFAKVPHIIRKNRSSVAVLSGNETPQSLTALADDIFLYYGLGCRNVSKLFVPKNYDFENLFSSLETYNAIADNHKYTNNLLYNKTIFVMNNLKFIDKEFYLLHENHHLHSPISVINYEYYDDLSLLAKQLSLQKDSLQCVASNMDFLKNNPLQVRLGETQNPQLDDYDDNINTLDFLTTI